MDADALDAIIARHCGRPGALLPILHDIQDAHGHVPASAVAPLAEALDLSRAEVHGVISFYHHFRTDPGGRRKVQVCRAEACQARGAERLLARVREALGCDLHETSRDGKYSLEPAYCLGHCACGPALTVDDQLHLRMTDRKFDALLAAAEEKKS